MRDNNSSATANNEYEVNTVPVEIKKWDNFFLFCNLSQNVSQLVILEQNIRLCIANYSKSGIIIKTQAFVVFIWVRNV